MPKPTQKSATAPHANLDKQEKEQAVEHSTIKAIVIHEVLREQGEEELERSAAALAWSGLAAGMSLGFSFLGQAIMRSALPERGWTRLIDSIGYTVGFLIVILGRQALFTESTLTAVLPVLVRRDRKTLQATARFWMLVLSCNLVGTYLFAALSSVSGVFSPEVEAALRASAVESMQGSFASTFIKAILAGWMIAVMVWLLPSARTAKIFIIMLLTYIVGIGGFSHVIAGSVEATYGVLHGYAPLGDYFSRFLIPTLLGNVLGGVGMAALLNHAPLAVDLEGSAGRPHSRA
jgi:formate/nitrite transporter FocA (FNT family)